MNIKIWDLTANELKMEVRLPNGDGREVVVVSLDGNYVVCYYCNVWRLEKGKPKHAWKADLAVEKRKTASACIFSPDSILLLLKVYPYQDFRRAPENDIRIYDVNKGKMTGTFKIPADVDACKSSPEGLTLLGTADATVRPQLLDMTHGEVKTTL